MLRARLVLGLALGLALAPHGACASAISSRILIDPGGEGDGDVFGCSVASVGDVNGDGYDDVIDFNGDGYAYIIIGARYSGLPGKAFIYFGGPTLGTKPDVTLSGEVTHSSTWFGASVASAGATDDPEGVGYNRGRAYVFANAFATTDAPPSPIAGLSFVGAQPNPARDEVRLVFALEHAVPVRITVYDVTGHEVAHPVEDEWLSGRVMRTWRPEGLTSGMYYASAKLGDRVDVRRMVWLGHRR